MAHPSSVPSSIRARGSVRRSSPSFGRAALVGASVVLIAVSSALQTGCTPRCQETCTKVLDCGLESTRVARDECIFACREQQDLYAEWEDETKIEAFKEHKRCLRAATCDEIEAGVCYDPELFVIDAPDAAEPEG